MIRAEIGKNNEAIQRAVGEALRTMCREVEERLLAKITALEDATKVFQGPWVEGQRYKAGAIVAIAAAGIYRALADTTARPGSSGDWQLVLKAGRDGRDGKDYTPPPPEPPGGPRSVRSSR